MKSNKLRDNFWIWGHPKNSCQEACRTTCEMPVTPAESARYFGVPNVFYVPWGHDMDMAVYGKDMKGIGKTGLAFDIWGKPGSDAIEETFKLVPLLKNLNRLVFDDFFNDEMPHIPTWSQLTIPKFLKIRDRIHAAGLEIWVVLYQHQLEMDIYEYLNLFDGVSFWFWSEPAIHEYHKYSKLFVDKTPGKRRLIGCYLYDFGRMRQASPELVRYQLDNNKKLMEQGEIEGVILHNNNFGGMGFSAYEEAKKWVDEHGDGVCYVKNINK